MPMAKAAAFDTASRYFNEVYNEDRLDLIDSLFAPDYEHTSSEGKVTVGAQRLAATVKFLKMAFPGLKMSIQHHADNGEMSMMVVRYTGGMPTFAAPALQGQQISFEETFVFWVHDGRIVRGRSYGTSAATVREMAGYSGNLLDMVATLVANPKTAEK